MKLLIAIMKKEDKTDTIAALNQKGIFVTELATTGGFLQEKNTTLMIGTEDANAPIALNVLREYAGLGNPSPIRRLTQKAEPVIPAPATLFPSTQLQAVVPYLN